MQSTHTPLGLGAQESLAHHNEFIQLKVTSTQRSVMKDIHGARSPHLLPASQQQNLKMEQNTSTTRGNFKKMKKDPEGGSDNGGPDQPPRNPSRAPLDARGQGTPVPNPKPKTNQDNGKKTKRVAP